MIRVLVIAAVAGVVAIICWSSIKAKAYWDYERGMHVCIAVYHLRDTIEADAQQVCTRVMHEKTDLDQLYN